MSYNRDFLSEGEKVVREFRPHWRMLAFPILWTLAALVILQFIWRTTDGTPGWVLTAAVAVFWIYFGLVRFIKWWFTLYVLTNERLITRSGVVARHGVEIPLERVNDITFSQNVLERILRSGDLVIESAGERGQSRFGDIPDPEGFQFEVYKVREEAMQQMQRDAARTPPGEDATAKLERLARLHREGSLSDAEYEAAKRSILGDI